MSKEVQLPQGFSSAGNRLLAAVLIIRRCLSWSGDRFLKIEENVGEISGDLVGRMEVVRDLGNRRDVFLEMEGEMRMEMMDIDIRDLEMCFWK